MTHTHFLTLSYAHTYAHRARGDGGEETEEDFDHRTEHIQALNQRGQSVMRRREESAQGERRESGEEGGREREGEELGCFLTSELIDTDVGA